MCGIYSTINKRVQLVLVAAGLTLAKFRSDQIGRPDWSRTHRPPQTRGGGVGGLSLTKTYSKEEWSLDCNSLKEGEQQSGWVRDQRPAAKKKKRDKE